MKLAMEKYKLAIYKSESQSKIPLKNEGNQEISQEIENVLESISQSLQSDPYNSIENGD